IERLMIPISREIDTILHRERSELVAVRAHLVHAEEVIQDLREEVADRLDLERWSWELDFRVVALEKQLRDELLRLDFERDEREAVQAHLATAEARIETLRLEVADRDSLEA